MKHGNKFVDEYPEYREFFEKLFENRELDDWYKNTCEEEFLLPNELFSLDCIERVDVSNRNWPSIDMNLYLSSQNGEGDFSLNQIVQLRISKIVPVYDINFCYSIKHNVISGFLDLWGAPQTETLMELNECIQEVMKQNGLLMLSELYDLHDTVYEWNALKKIDEVNRRLTLQDAVFEDVLELCN